MTPIIHVEGIMEVVVQEEAKDQNAVYVCYD